MPSLLEDAYSPEHFRKQAHRMVDRLADYLARAADPNKDRVFKSLDPEKLYSHWKAGLDQPGGRSFADWTNSVIEDSIHLHNPGYMGHQVSPVLPRAALADFMGALLNNGVGVYEMGSPTVAMERVVIKHLAAQIGFDDNADGILTSGGTLGNLTALLTARQVKAAGNAWDEGTGNQQLGVMVSEEAHYSISRAVKILGWGEQGIVKVPVDGRFRMDAATLQGVFEEASQKGVNIIGIVGSACSTATGSFDPLPELAEFSKNNNLWFHVDAAHGGGALYSEKHGHLLEGINRADSVIVDFHKMLMCPALVTGVIFKKGEHSYQTFAQKAEYLWKQKGNEWFNLGKRTFECTKDMMALKVYSTLNSYGKDLFKENVDCLFCLAHEFGRMIEARPQVQVLTKPQSNIVCFRHMAAGTKDLNEHNEAIRTALLQKGEHYIVQTNINGIVWLRITLMNPFTKKEHLGRLLNQIEEIAGHQ